MTIPGSSSDRTFFSCSAWDITCFHSDRWPFHPTESRPVIIKRVRSVSRTLFTDSISYLVLRLRISSVAIIAEIQSAESLPASCVSSPVATELSGAAVWSFPPDGWSGSFSTPPGWLSPEASLTEIGSCAVMPSQETVISVCSAVSAPDEQIVYLFRCGPSVLPVGIITA